MRKRRSSSAAADTEAVTPEPHYVADYRALAKHLLATYPEDVAVRMGVGDGADQIGPMQLAILTEAGLRPEHVVIDVGCGCGQLAETLLGRVAGYLGTDVVPEFVEYARRRTRAPFEFAVVDSIAIPAPDASADMVCMFSVLTHLQHHESYRLLEEAVRVLRPGGRIVATFLELACAAHWQFFDDMVRVEHPAHLNAFIEAAVWPVWAEHLGLRVEHLVPADTPWAAGTDPVGQSIVVLAKR